MPVKQTVIGNRTHAFDLDKVKSMGHRAEGGEDILYEGVCPICDDNPIVLTKNNYIENPVTCTCGAKIAFELDDILDRAKTRKFLIVVWFEQIFLGFSQAQRRLDRRGKAKV